MVYIASNSPNAAFQDEIAHINLARSAWEEPKLILNVWGRPFNTLIYILPARAGIGAARITSVLMACCIVLLTTHIAQKFGLVRTWLIPLCLWFQPWFADWYYTANTMIPLSFLIVLGIALWQNNQISWASVPFGLLPLTRHEGIALTGIWVLYVLIFQKKWKPVVISLTPLLLYNILYLGVYQTIASTNLTMPRPTTRYGSGSWLHYVPGILFGVYPSILILSLFGITPVICRKTVRLIFAPYLIYFLTHVIIYRFGLFASGGYDFFLVPLAPAFAITGAVGADRLLQQSYRQRQREYGNGKYRALLIGIILMVAATGLLLTPRRPYDKEATASKQASMWLNRRDYADSDIYSTHAWFQYFHQLSYQNAVPASLTTLPAGTIVVWDAHYSERHKINIEKFAQGDWQRLAEFGEGFIIIFQKC